MPEARKAKTGDTAHLAAVADLETLKAYHQRQMEEALNDPDKIPAFMMGQLLALTIDVKEIKLEAQSGRDRCMDKCRPEIDAKFNTLFNFRANIKGVFSSIGVLAGLAGLILGAYELMKVWLG